MSRVTQRGVLHVLTQDQRDDSTSVCGDLISSADEDVMFLYQIRRQNMVFSVQSATNAAISHLEITIKAKTEETATGQVRRQGDAGTVFRLTWNCSPGIHPRRIDCKQAPLQGDLSLSLQFILL
jgi:hypothetical protein